MRAKAPPTKRNEKGDGDENGALVPRKKERRLGTRQMRLHILIKRMLIFRGIQIPCDIGTKSFQKNMSSLTTLSSSGAAEMLDIKVFRDIKHCFT